MLDTESAPERTNNNGDGKPLTKENNMKNLKQLMNNLVADESGQDLIEYALVAALVGLGAVASMKSLGSAINTAFTTVGNSLTSNV